jgi:hypothetical protein
VLWLVGNWMDVVMWDYYLKQRVVASDCMEQRPSWQAGS